MAEGATHVAICNDRRKIAFTLAEVLITLGVVGVVAAITMPVLMTNINMRINSERHANIAYKMTQAMEQMRAHGKLVQYENTEKFVDELQKYLKIQKRCSASNIAECWPTETITDAAGFEYDVADCKQRKNLLAGSDSNDNNVGLILADGASIILTYDPNAKAYDIGDAVPVDKEHSLPIGKGKSKSFAYTTGVTAPIDFVTDVNGKKGPNSETINGKYNDIRQFRVARFVDPAREACTGDYYNKTCVKLAGTGSTWSPVNCSSGNSSSADYQAYCGPTPSGYGSDMWAGAKKLCAEAGMTLPDEDTLYNIYTAWKTGGQYQTELASAGSYWFWSSTEGSNYPECSTRAVDFTNGGRYNDNKSSNNGANVVLCVGP